MDDKDTNVPNKTDFISREEMHKANRDEWEGVYGHIDCDIFEDNESMIDRVPAVDVVEVVRCKDCQYWRDAYVKENDGTERQYRDDDVDPLGMMGVTIDIGSNIWSMCLLENNCGWELNKSIFRNENDFCSRGEKRPCSYEKWWGISDGIYPKPDIKEG